MSQVTENTGRILKGVGGLYTVLDGEGQLTNCRARGKFRIQKLTPVAGDTVRFQYPEGEAEEGYLLEILPRANVLRRPPIANLTLLIVTLSAGDPKPDFLLADRLLVTAQRLNIPAMVCVNKVDAYEEDPLLDEYAAGYPLVKVSAATGQGLDALKEKLKGQVACFAGQSGVGKSSLLNALDGGEREVGGLSRHSRGRNTTRSVEFLQLAGGLVADTAGFSLYEDVMIPPEELASHFPEFTEAAAEGCRFQVCLHHKEPDCSVRAAVAEGRVPQGRYERYIQLLEEYKERWRNRYE